MRKTAYTFGLIFLLGIGIVFVLQDVLMGLNSLIFILPQIIFVMLLFLVLRELYNSWLFEDGCNFEKTAQPFIGFNDITGITIFHDDSAFWNGYFRDTMHFHAFIECEFTFGVEFIDIYLRRFIQINDS